MTEQNKRFVMRKGKRFVVCEVAPNGAEQAVSPDLPNRKAALRWMDSHEAGYSYRFIPSEITYHGRFQPKQ